MTLAPHFQHERFHSVVLRTVVASHSTRSAVHTSETFLEAFCYSVDGFVGPNLEINNKTRVPVAAPVNPKAPLLELLVRVHVPECICTSHFVHSPADRRGPSIGDRKQRLVVISRTNLDGKQTLLAIQWGQRVSYSR